MRIQKKFILPMLVSLAFSSCLDYSLPKKIELEVEGSIDLPVKTSTSSWGAALAKSIEKKFFSEELAEGLIAEIYNVNYGQNIQAFCVYLRMEMSDSLNPDDYIEGIADLTKLNGMQSLEIDEAIEIPSFEDFALAVPVSQTLPPGITFPPGLDTVPFTGTIQFDIDPPPIPLGTSISADFLHALIGEGNFTIDLDMSGGNIILAKEQFTITYEIGISQEDDVSSPGSSLSSPYPGLDYPSTSSTLTERPLDGRHINGKPVEISGRIILAAKAGATVTIINPAAPQVLKGQLGIKMNFKKYEELDWDFRKISNELRPDPVSLANVAKNLNYILFDPCDVDENGESKAGIGITLNLTEAVDGLAISVLCSDLDFPHDSKPLHKGNNVFGNENPLKLELADYKNNVKKLQFDITLLPDGGNNDVLHLTNLEAGKALSIKGEAKLFQHWVEAEVNMIEALKAANIDDSTFEGAFPDTVKGEKPIDLSFINDYLDGFYFMKKDIQAAAYISGPDKTIKLTVDSSLSIDARYQDESFTVMEQKKLTLAEKYIVIKDNPGYLDRKGSYKNKELPPDGDSVNFLEVINARPDNLVFIYNIELPETLIVTPEMFVYDDNDNVSHNIAATIILLINMELTAGDDGGRIKYPDMFEGQNDLFGREADANDPSRPKIDSMFTSLNVGYISLAVNFADSFFSGGRLFLEKADENYQPVLFPNGIPVNGKKISANINSKDFDKIKKNFIVPDFRLEFEKGGKISIPRNIGLTSISIEAKGKNSLELDFNK